MRARYAARRSQRGVALITAMIIFALAMILAGNVAFRAFLDQRRAAALIATDQAYEIAVGAEAWAADILREDAKDSKTDDLSEAWAQPLPVLPVDEIGTIEGRLVDLQGRFNLNNLINPQDGTPNPERIKQLERILVQLEIESSWAGTIADWVDPDDEPGFPEGAEDSIYTSLTPPHRTANMPITRVSELLVLPQFGLDRYRRLAPYVAALPVGTKLNTCTAAGIVLDALSESEQNFADAEAVAKQRAERCFPTPDDLRNTLGDEDYDKVKDQITDSTKYFLATVWVTIGSTQFTLYSLLDREPNGPIRPILRSFGTE
jgi:general secretion pathway protein K